MIKNITQAEQNSLQARKINDSFKRLINSNNLTREQERQLSFLQGRRVGDAQSGFNATQKIPVDQLINTNQSSNVISESIDTASDKLVDRIAALKGYGATVVQPGTTIDKVDIESDNTEEPYTYVPSDPNKPDDLESSASETIEYKRNKQYTPYIDPIQNKYNLKNGRNIRENDIIDITSRGIIVQPESNNPSDLSMYKYYTEDDLEVQNKPVINEFNTFTPEEYIDPMSGQDQFHHKKIDGSVRTEQLLRYRYNFGLDDIVAERHELVPVAGYITSPILVKGSQYIELCTSVFDNVEYSIIDGDIEVPILPVDQNTIVNERLFYGLMPRFTITNPTEIIVRRNMETELAIVSLQELELFLTANSTDEEISQSSFAQSDLYTIDYIPDSSAKQYIPRNNHIQLKIIQRNYPGQVPVPIRDISIRKYGITTTWYLSSFDDTSDGQKYY